MDISIGNKFIKNISQTLFEMGATVSNGRFVIDGGKHTSRQMIKMLPAIIESDSERNAWQGDYFVQNDEQRILLLNRIYKRLYALVKNKVESSLVKSDIVVEEFPWETFQLFQDIRNGDNFFVSSGRIVSDLNYDAWLAQIPKANREIVARPRAAVREYNPYTLMGWESKEVFGITCTQINTYVPPNWRLEIPPENTECPEIIERVLEHLFPDDGCREFVLDWLYTALMDKNETFLVLNGAKGVGKGVFCSLGKLLVGREHYSEVPESLVTSQFNSVLLEHRLLTLDEYTVDKKAHTKLKRFINAHVNVEKKGVDASHAQPTYNSYVISNNDEDSQYLEWDDRRFSVPDLNAENLTTVMSEQEINDLVGRIEDNDMELAAQWGNYILNRGADNSKFTCWKGETFWKLVYVSLKNWQKHLVDKILYGGDEMIDLCQLRKSYKREEKGIFPNRDKVADFLKNYRHNGSTDRLGEVVCEDGEFFVEVKNKREDLGDFL